MKKLYGFYLTIIFTAVLSLNLSAQVSGGGTFTLDQSVIAGGGDSGGAGGSCKLEGTIGQAAAGTRSNAAPFNLQNGFWTAAPFAPTASQISVSGQITTANGNGIRNVLITLTEANGVSRTTLSTTFGYYNFAGIAAGQTVVISVRAKRFEFLQSAQVVFVSDNTDKINFVANEM